jgi:hypothetical protein
MLVEGQSIGSTTAAAGTFTTLTANNGTLTASAPVLDLAQTWNNAAVTFSGLLLNVTNTASATASRLVDLQVDGTNRFRMTPASATQLSIGGSGVAWNVQTRTASGVGCNFQNIVGLGSRLEFLATATATGGGDVHLVRDAADTLAQRQTTNAQTFRIYNTFTSDTNHERGFLKWSSNVFQVGTEKGSGGGTARALEFQTDGVTRLIVSTTGLIQIGGASSAHVALKRNSNTLQIRTADDLGFGGLLCGALTLHGNLDASTRNIVTDTTTGTKIGTGTTQKVGFFNATPVVQQAAVADATDAASTQDRLNDLLARLRTLGLIAT